MSIEDKVRRKIAMNTCSLCPHCPYCAIKKPCEFGLGFADLFIALEEYEPVVKECLDKFRVKEVSNEHKE